jgi:hypothetical protein
MHVGTDRRIPPTTGFIEHFVDRQIDYYLLQLSEKLDSIDVDFARLERAAEVLVQKPSAEKSIQAQQGWKEALERIEDQAGDLRNMLSYVFAELESKDDFKLKIEEESLNSVFEQERRYLGQQIFKAVRRIKTYFFESNNTIESKDLAGENMLIYLYRVKETAKGLKRVW